jgi:hypothetical protein
MKFELTEVNGFKAAFRGMRNPKNSWHLSDSYFGLITDLSEYDYEVADDWARFLFKDDTLDSSDDNFSDLSDKIDQWLIEQGQLRGDYDVFDVAFIGPKDMKLAQQLESGGSEHRKFLRQIQISVDITAPLYWWKEFDTYKVGTTANSTSTMHKLTSKPITLDCFEIDDYKGYELFLDEDDVDKSVDWEVKDIIEFCEKLRQKYLETKDKRYWKELVRWLPESWLQTRTVTMNYENVFNMVNQRGNHKLNEWSGNDDEALENFIAWAKSLPYANELIFNQTAEPFILFEKHNNL